MNAELTPLGQPVDQLPPHVDLGGRTEEQGPSALADPAERSRHPRGGVDRSRRGYPDEVVTPCCGRCRLSGRRVFGGPAETVEGRRHRWQEMEIFEKGHDDSRSAVKDVFSSTKLSLWRLTSPRRGGTFSPPFRTHPPPSGTPQCRSILR